MLNENGKTVNKRSWEVLAATIVMALIISSITAVLPIYFAVPRFIYANVVPVVLVALAGGPLPAIVYGLLSCFVLNNIGMGSGVTLNMMIFQMIEAGTIGLMLYNKKMNVFVRICFTMLACTLVLKLVSFILYYYLGSSKTQDSVLSYISNTYRYYLSDSLAANVITYSFSLITAAVLYYAIDKLLKSKKKR